MRAQLNHWLLCIIIICTGGSVPAAGAIPEDQGSTIKCSSSIIVRADFDAVYKGGALDINKLLASTPFTTENWTFTFTQPSKFTVSYDVRLKGTIIQSGSFHYPEGADVGKPDLALKRFKEIVRPFNSVGLYQCQSYFLGEPLDAVLSQAVKLGEAETSRQFQLDGPVKSTVIVTDKRTGQITYIVSIPAKKPAPLEAMGNDLRRKLKSSGMSDSEIEQKVKQLTSNPALEKAMTQMAEQLEKLPRDVQIDSYSSSKL